ncbi:hypothetical protein NQ318_022327 [Aromia moschata]|uniref:Uncharacterized protein n=1 Tax=Aromia moschata TaxID=1265417 RepID=A0AAV8Z7A1_9CUCU|nr:hypothetical protein NQ318_022327 [Aromia moschata]
MAFWSPFETDENNVASDITSENVEVILTLSNRTPRSPGALRQARCPPNPAEMPPPPYHIAVMLSPQNDLDAIQVIRDSPPPSYEKAIT